MMPIRNPDALALCLVIAAFALQQQASAADPKIRAFETGIRPAIEIEGEPKQRWTIEERMRYYHVPAVSVAVIRNGRIAWAKGYGVKVAGTQDHVDAATVFSVGSLSKVGAAAATMRLVDAGKLDLDADVNGYLKRWQVPANNFTAVRAVTLRGIMSHSAGLSLDGFPDFLPGEKLPTVIDTLEGRPPSKTVPVRVVYLPGSESRYSGGGTTVEQLLLEDVTGETFPAIARSLVFEPLGMSRSTYENPLPQAHGNIAHAHDKEGKPTALPRGWEAFPEMAASGLWTTPSDYAQLICAFIASYRGEPGSFLSQARAREMMTEVGPSPYGLGPHLGGAGALRRFMHSGSNDSFKAWMEGNLSSGNGVVIFTNAVQGSQLWQELRRSLTLAEGWPVAATVELPKVALPQSELQALTGIYELDLSSISARRVMPEEGSLHAVGLREGRLYLGAAGTEPEEGRLIVPESRTRFYMGRGYFDAVELLTRIEFVRDYTGKVEALILREGEHTVEAKKLN